MASNRAIDTTHTQPLIREARISCLASHELLWPAFVGWSSSLTTILKRLQKSAPLGVLLDNNVSSELPRKIASSENLTPGLCTVESAGRANTGDIGVLGACNGCGVIAVGPGELDLGMNAARRGLGVGCAWGWLKLPSRVGFTRGVRPVIGSELSLLFAVVVLVYRGEGLCCLPAVRLKGRVLGMRRAGTGG